MVVRVQGNEVWCRRRRMRVREDSRLRVEMFTRDAEGWGHIRLIEVRSSSPGEVVLERVFPGEVVRYLMWIAYYDPETGKGEHPYGDISSVDAWWETLPEVPEDLWVLKILETL